MLLNKSGSLALYAQQYHQVRTHPWLDKRAVVLAPNPDAPPVTSAHFSFKTLVSSFLVKSTRPAIMLQEETCLDKVGEKMWWYGCARPIFVGGSKARSRPN